MACLYKVTNPLQIIFPSRPRFVSFIPATPVAPVASPVDPRESRCSYESSFLFMTSFSEGYPEQPRPTIVSEGRHGSKAAWKLSRMRCPRHNKENEGRSRSQSKFSGRVLLLYCPTITMALTVSAWPHVFAFHCPYCTVKGPPTIPFQTPTPWRGEENSA